jgi:hypothetical protein
MITIPEAVLAFRLLDKANLTLSEKQLALTASSDIKYATMKSAFSIVSDSVNFIQSC